MHACRVVCVNEDACVCFFALTCAICCFVAYPDVTAACMSVPVRGHHTNTMNVDVFQFLDLYFPPKVFAVMSLITRIRTDDKTSIIVCLFGVPDRLIIDLLLVDNFDHYEYITD